ncbi:MAG: hypothetical protein COA88_02315 [Kordia sp.]|nr:MAG: hypothetical protein COA88_02315 [Kordia sp.]
MYILKHLITQTKLHMKKITLRAVFTAFMVMSISVIQAQSKNATGNVVTTSNLNNGITYNQLTKENQQSLNSTGYVKCASLEMHERRMQREGNSQYNDAFNDWLEPLVEQRKLLMAQQKANGTFKMAVTTIPIIFHIITDGVGAENLSAAQIQAQIDQLNLDFSNQAGSTNPVAADAMVQFVPAQVDPSGTPLAEPGIDRITTFGDGPFPTSDFDVGDGGLEIKSTVWDRSQYANIWTADISGGILGYAQFPSNSTLPGFNVNGGTAQNDGVVIGYGTAGSVAIPGTAGQYNLGRTLTHEIGHWIGLRHIWGDGGCGVDDYCNDTPSAGGANYGTAQNTSCGSADQVENYMDYTDDAIMNIFTADQVARIATVISVADGFVDLVNSTTGDADPTVSFLANSSANPSEGSECSFTDITRTVSLGVAANAITTVNFTVNNGGTTATNGVDFQLMTNSVSFATGVTGTRDITIRLFHDAFVEGDETVQIDFSVTTSGDAVAGVNNSVTITIADDDIVPASTYNATIFSDDFESYTDFAITNVGNWTMIDNDGDATYGADTQDFTNEAYTGSFIVFNPAATTPASGAGWAAHGGDKGFYCFNSNGSVSGTPLNDDYAITPQMTNGTNGEIKFWAQSLTDNYAGGERFQIGVSETNDGNGITYVTPGPYVIPPIGGWTEYTYTIPASFDNKNIYVAIHVVSADEFVFMFDDISVTADVTKAIQTTVNDGVTNDQLNLPGTGTVYTSDSSSGDLMSDIINNDTFNYGCTTSSVFRAGTGAEAYNGSTSPNLAMNKVFNILPTTTTNSGDTTVKFYFTETEIAGWEATTGLTRASLVIYRESGNEIITPTIGAFGSNVTLTGSFTGLNGNYYFGTTATFAKISVSPKVYLQGAALNPNSGEESLMRDDLRVAGVIPTTSPYVDALVCNASVFTTAGANAIVDWVFVELRDETTNTTIVYSQSALLQRDGDVVGVDGISALTFDSVSRNFHITIKHRNHLGIMSSSAIALSSSPTTVDFTNSASQITYGSNAQTSFGIPSGVVAMYAGNVGGDISVRYQGSGNDTNTIKDQVLADVGNTTTSNLHLFTGYNMADVNLDGSIRYQGSGNDSNTIKDVILAHPDNQSSPSNLFLILEQLPEN